MKKERPTKTVGLKFVAASPKVSHETLYINHPVNRLALQPDNIGTYRQTKRLVFQSQYKPEPGLIGVNVHKNYGLANKRKLINKKLPPAYRHVYINGCKSGLRGYFCNEACV